MPLYTLKLNLSLQVLFIFFGFSFSGATSLASESETIVVLPSITVIGIQKSDNTFTQVSEVEWDESNDRSVVKERDGSFTAKSTTNPYNLKSLIVSLGSPLVNLDIRYAKRSSSMTADGRLVFNKLVEALEYLDEGTRLELIPTRDASSKSNDALMQRRLDELLRLISSKNNIGVEVKPSQINRTLPESTVGTSDLWRIKFRQIRAL